MDTLALLGALVMGFSANLSVPPSQGIVEGALLYPACTGLPQDLQVCAEAEGSEARFCTKTFVDKNGYRYQLELPAGRYNIYAQAESARPGYRAYYSAAIPCGLKVSCTDHQPLTVQVESGRVNSSISPADWFANQGASSWKR